MQFECGGPSRNRNIRITAQYNCESRLRNTGQKFRHTETAPRLRKRNASHEKTRKITDKMKFAKAYIRKIAEFDIKNNRKKNSDAFFLNLLFARKRLGLTLYCISFLLEKKKFFL